ncbi:MAG: OprO/OprP family phosphate-selective porin [Gammaproteobacteria bacterium]|nr:OprO/OprP family phosphate-selective porin [Gammaproteobacteria bacterium]
MMFHRRILRARSVCATVFSLPLFAALPTANAAGTGPTSNAYNPALGLILSGTFGEFSHSPEEYNIAGYPLGGESEPGQEGFALGESELHISANIDQSWYGAFTFAMANDEAAVENAYVQTTALGNGLTFRAGRFFSGVGYMNEQHAHSWQFVDPSLAYRALLGSQYGDDGVQIRWLAPLDVFTEFGAEWFNGSAFPAGGSAKHGTGSWSGFVHLGGDLGNSHSWRAGVSYLQANADARASGDPDNPDLFDGRTHVAIADLVWKWAPGGNAADRSLTLQAEYLRSRHSGSFTPAGNAAVSHTATSDGWYAQAVYQFAPRWRAGLRHDALDAMPGNVALAGTALDGQGHAPTRSSAMLDYSSSEFSRWRLQYNRDQSQAELDHQWLMQFTMSLGAHGAHTF